MDIVKTKFIAQHSINVNEISGCGWGASWVLSTKAKIGDVVFVETFQKPDNSQNDSSIRIHFPGEIKDTTFENLGRLVACGALKQIDL